MANSEKTLNSEEVDFLLSGAGTSDAPQGDTETAADEQAVTMRGDLEQINLSDIFQTLAMTKMEGVLRVRNPLEQRQVYCLDGYVRILVPPRIATRRLGQRLVQAGLLQPEQLRGALVRQRKEQKPLGELLVADGLLQQDQIDEIAGMQVSGDLFSLFTWRHGTFEFWKGEITDPDLRAQFEVCPEFEVSSLLLEVARRSDEWESIFSAISSLDEVPMQLLEVPEGTDLDDAGQALIHGADGRSTYRQIAEQTTLGLFEVSRVARDLVRQGILGNIGEAEMVAVAEAEAEAGHQKNALMMLQTLRDRPGDRDLDIVRGMVTVLDKAGERRLAGNLLLELAQLQSDPDLALSLAREARDLSPNDAGTISFLRTTLIAHSPPDSAELEQCTVDLLDALIDGDRLETAVEILADARATGTMRPQILLREARALQKQRNPQGAANAMFELAEIYRAEGDRQRTMEAYQAILRIDRSRKDVQKLLRQIRQTRAGRIIRAVAVTLCVSLLGAMGVVFWQQRTFDAAVQSASREIGELLHVGNRVGAREALDHWAVVLGDGEPVEDLRSQVDFAEAAERTRLNKLARRQMNERLTLAAETLGSGDLRAALAVYEDLYRTSAFRNEIHDVVGTRLEAVLVEVEQAAKTMASRLPVDPIRVVDRKGLVSNLADLQTICRPPLLRTVEELERLLASSGMPEFVPEATRAHIAEVVPMHHDIFARAAALTRAYTDALQRNQTERRLDPLFKQAVQLEDKYDFAAALEIYRELESEPSGEASLRAHFRDQIARNATICRLLEALSKATERGDFPAAQQQFRALTLGFPEIPFATIARLPLRIESLPTGANVECNGMVIGQSPCTLAYLPADENAITVTMPGFQAERTVIRGDQIGLFHTSLQLLPTFERKHENLVEQPPLAEDPEQTIFVDRGGCVVAVDRGDGHTLWTFRSGDLSGLLSRPFAHADEVVVGSLDGELRALDRATGAPRWSLPDLPTEAGMVRTGDYLLLATTNHKLVAVDLSKHAVAASVVLPAAGRGAVQVHGSTVMCATEDGRMLAYSLPQLEPLWQRKLDGWGDLTSVCGEEALFVADERGHLGALDFASGEVRWQRARDTETFGAPIVNGSSILVASPQQILRCATADGAEQPGIPMSEEPWSEPPTRIGSRLLAPARDGSIHVIDLATSNPLYRIEGGKRGARALPIGDTVVVAMPDRRLLFFPPLR
jgi:tetratricopeptide (TPR) repeat protein